MSKNDLLVEFSEEGIHFPKGYFFRQSSIRSDRFIARNAITEIRMNSYPPSLVINDQEIIFIPHQFKDQLEAFGQTHDIPLVDGFDIWAAINEPFVDTEFDKAQQEQTLHELERNGLSRGEVQRIRKRVGRTMSFYNFFAWEWIHLGQFDYLNWTFLTKRKYWWSMEIALRNRGGTK